MTVRKRDGVRREKEDVDVEMFVRIYNALM